MLASIIKSTDAASATSFHLLLERYYTRKYSRTSSGMSLSLLKSDDRSGMNEISWENANDRALYESYWWNIERHARESSIPSFSVLLSTSVSVHFAKNPYVDFTPVKETLSRSSFAYFFSCLDLFPLAMLLPSLAFLSANFSHPLFIFACAYSSTLFHFCYG